MDANGVLTYGMTTYFQALDVREALAHEFAAAALKGEPTWDDLPLRRSTTDLPMAAGVLTLTLSRDGHFLAHQRDGRAVADAGGNITAVPAGTFQPTSDHTAAHDFDLWRTIMREYAEELLGYPERRGTIDYDNDEPFATLDKARQDNRIQLYYYGTTMDPLTLGVSHLTVAVLDELPQDIATTNDEGRVLKGIPFTEQAIAELEPRLSLGTLHLLRRAHLDRERLLAPGPQ
ncbi:hypothetical protein [Actinokineospora terrae]|uniref:hypothetical protein n=1 Tax=Actinokineospora terrae TaxID=155974 RepID=UPI00116090A2|nr:hypothetical protein [Actinokineospora terrae]